MSQIQYEIIEAVAHEDPAWFTLDSTIESVYSLCKPKEIITMYINHFRDTLTQYMIRNLMRELYVVGDPRH